MPWRIQRSTLKRCPSYVVFPSHPFESTLELMLVQSPDIIPLYGAKADQDTLVHPTSWRGFAGMPIVGGDVNHVYIRGHGSGGPYVATLRAFPSELILWPQVWSAIEPVSSGPVVISGGDTTGPCRCIIPFCLGVELIWIIDASDSPLWFRPPHTAGNAYSLVANVFKPNLANVNKNLEEYEPVPSFNPQNFGVDDFSSFLSQDNNFTFYNVKSYILSSERNMI